MPDDGLGALAAALAKAQAAFPPIPRDREVEVKLKTGGSYKFKYAPLDTILSATRKPLSDNGLAIAQLLDSDPDGAPALVTMLVHADGGSVTGRTPIPHNDGETVQAFGSAITYLRRYAIQALLGIAAEEDDDGNSASGNTATFRERSQAATVYSSTNPPPPAEATADGLIGTVEEGKSPVDLHLREGREGPAWGFKLKNGSKSYQVLAQGDLANALALVVGAGTPFVGQRVEVWGRIALVPWEKDGKSMPPFARIDLARIKTPDFILPAQEGPSEPSVVTDAAAGGGSEPPPDALQDEIDALPMFDTAA